MIKLGLRVGDERFAGYIDRMGFGRRTTIDLPGEERGQTQPASKWSKVSIGAISMGQELAVTPLQVVSMVSAVANGGILYRPYVVQKIQGADGVTEMKPRGERVMSQTTAQQLQEMLEVVVTDGTAKSSKLDGYRAAGKTGTAQKYDPKIRTYSNSKYIASFAGFAPASNPQIAMVVVIDEPHGLYHGGEVAAPIFKKVAEQILRSRSVLPDVPLYAPQYKPSIKPQSKPAPLLRVNQAPEWKVVPASTKALLPDEQGSELGDVVVPDFTGKSLRDVTVESSRLGLKLVSGKTSGRAFVQSPVPGTRVPAGSKIQVRFATR
jgi:membrane peptidoglycan carboxypeptidase